MADHPFTGTLSVTDKIGIGVDDPIAQLHIASSTDAPSQAFLESGGVLLKLSVDASSASIGTANAFPLSIQTDGTPRISINGTGSVDISAPLSVQNTLTISGNVGIGTIASNHKLAIAAGDINIDDSRALRQAGRWVIGGDSNVLSIGSAAAPDGRDIRFDPGFAGALTIKKDTGNVGIGTASPAASLHIHSNNNVALQITNTALSKTARMGVDALGVWIEPSEMNSSIRLNANPSLVGLYVRGTDGNVGIGTTSPTERLHVANGGIKVSTTTIAAPGVEVIREVLPLALATDSSFVDIGAAWTPITRTIYAINQTTAPLPGSQRKYKLVIRSGNNCRSPDGHISKYRLFFSWAGQPDNKEYDGILYWGDLNEGAWDTVTLDHHTNPSGAISYWRLEGYASGCTNRVFNVTIQVVDLIQ